MVVIGVTPAQDDQGRITVNQDYLNAIIRAGAVPMLFPLVEDERSQIALLTRVNGLMLTGGPDIDPALYGEEKIPACGEISDKRDALEISLCKIAVDIGLPVLGICRGLQVMNVALGGTLYQDVESQLTGAIAHPCYDQPRDGVHEVKVRSGSILRKITCQERLSVNSRHHQGIKTLGQGLTATAYAPDGLVEAIEFSGEDFVLGVQWHPESMADRFPEAKAIFNRFVRACG